MYQNQTLKQYPTVIIYSSHINRVILDQDLLIKQRSTKKTFSNEKFPQTYGILQKLKIKDHLNIRKVKKW